MTWSATSRAKAISWVTMIMVVFCGRQVADDPQHLAGELRVQGGGGLVKAEDVGLHGQRPGDGHPLLLAAGELVRVMVRPVLQTHLGKQLPARPLDLGAALAAPLGSHQLPGQHDVLQRRVLGKKIEGLEHQPEVKALAADLPLQLGGGVGGVEEGLALHAYGAAVGPLQKVEAAEQGGLAAAGGADDGQGLALFQGEADVLQDGGLLKTLAEIPDFQYRHFWPLLTRGNSSASFRSH
jgi:hypothetical protein